MLKTILFTSIFSLSALFISNAQAQELTKEQVEAIVKEYIANNGEEITKSLEKFALDEQYKAFLASIRPHTPVWGNPEATVTLVEFSDFRCGFCRKAQSTISDLRKTYKNRVKFAFKHMPILSKQSADAAMAAQAAGKQDKFWEYSAELWRNQGRIGEELFVSVAEDLKLDMDKFNADRQSESMQDEINLDIEDGRNVGMRGTPYFMINGETLSGAQPLEQFIAIIEAKLKEANAQ